MNTNLDNLENHLNVKNFDNLKTLQKLEYLENKSFTLQKLLIQKFNLQDVSFYKNLKTWMKYKA